LEQEPAAKRFFEEIELFLGKQSEQRSAHCRAARQIIRERIEGRS
jgi:hypothetical protein